MHLCKNEVLVLVKSELCICFTCITLSYIYVFVIFVLIPSYSDADYKDYSNYKDSYIKIPGFLF